MAVSNTLMVRQKPLFNMAVLQYILFLITWLAEAAPRPQGQAPTALTTSSTYWLSQIPRQGSVAFGSDTSYQIFRNVKDYGAVGDGVTDDTDAINTAIADGQRCGLGCDSSTTVPAIVYFPPGSYAVSAPIVQYYYTQLVGDAVTVPTIHALPNFQGIAVIDSDPYVPGGNGANWYTNQNNFFRQIRNFVIDLTKLSDDVGAGIHWQVAQASSLQNIVFNMLPPSATNKQQGIFMDNGSGGFMTDLIFNGGNYGAFFGNQQFTTRNLTFNGCSTAIFMNWNWLWTFKSVTISDCDVGIDMSNLVNGVNQTVGSVVVLDSVMTNTRIGVKTSYNSTSLPKTGGTLTIQNVDFTSTTTAVLGADGVQVILNGGTVVQSWAQGDAYVPSAGVSSVKRSPRALSARSVSTVTVIPLPLSATGSASSSSTGGSSSASPESVQSTRIQQSLTAPTLPVPLMNGDAVFERSKPQYETVPVSSFVSVKSLGAKGDGVTDDTDAIQNILNNARTDQVVYFDHGAYVISKTVNVPKNIRITGEIWPLIMATGTAFSDQNNPQPVFRVGTPGDTGAVEISDIIFETMGPAPGAILVEWNVADSNQGSCGMWDVHFRIGGTAGTQLQQNTCIGNVSDTQTFKPECAGAFLMMHITQQSTAYLENCWFWVADHELDITLHNQTNIYNGRGLLVESQGPVWLWGTSSEHSQFYNYQISNAKNIFMGAIQTETAYMQAAPNALNAGFTPNPAYSDPDFASCTTDSCKKTWGLRVVNSSDVYMYGAGLYSFFDNYLQECLLTESCQDNMVDLESSSSVYLYGLTTKAATNMVIVDGQVESLQQDHTNGFGQTLALFEQA